jgi:hypothetical protein
MKSSGSKTWKLRAGPPRNACSAAAATADWLAVAQASSLRAASALASVTLAPPCGSGKQAVVQGFGFCFHLLWICLFGPWRRLIESAANSFRHQ